MEIIKIHFGYCVGKHSPGSWYEITPYPLCLDRPAAALCLFIRFLSFLWPVLYVGVILKISTCLRSFAKCRWIITSIPYVGRNVNPLFSPYNDILILVRSMIYEANLHQISCCDDLAIRRLRKLKTLLSSLEPAITHDKGKIQYWGRREVYEK